MAEQNTAELIVTVERNLAILAKPLQEWGSPDWKKDKEQARGDIWQQIPALLDIARAVAAAEAPTTVEYKVDRAPGFDLHTDLADAQREADYFADRGAVVQRRHVTQWENL